MAKQSNPCPCGGSYDGTPSGIKKHEATARHQALVQREAARLDDNAAREAGERYENTDPADDFPWTRNEDGTFNSIPEYDAQGEEIRAFVHTLRREQGEAEDQLERREADLRWRRKHMPDKADEYEAKKVAPLSEKIERLEGEIKGYDEILKAQRDASLEPVRKWAEAMEQEVKARFGDRGYVLDFDHYSEWSGGRVNVYLEGDKYHDTSVSFGDVERFSDKTFTFRPVTISQTGSGAQTVEDKRAWLARDNFALEIAEFIEALYN